MATEELVGLCWKCAQVVTEVTEEFCGTLVKEPVGCEGLTKEQWDEGLVSNPCWHQSNCPLTARS